MLSYFPKYIANKAVTFYLVTLVLVSLLFFNHAMSFLWIAFGLIEVMGFFYFSNKLSKEWQRYSERTFEKKIFRTSLIIRIIYVLFSYLFYYLMTNKPFEFATADAFGYHQAASWILQCIKEDKLSTYFASMKGSYSDVGYPFYLSLVYYITGSSILIARIVKALLSAYMSVLIYRLASRNFGENVGRIAAVFAMLMPHFIYYCGLHLKETEMIFLSVWFLERVDFLLRSKNYSFKNIILPLLLVGSLFFFRTVLGVAALFAVVTAVLFSDSRIIHKQKRLFMMLWTILAIGVFLGGTIAQEVEAVWQKSGTDAQAANMEWRTKRDGGNEFAKYAGATVFAPLIFTIPFPTLIHIDSQENQMMVNGNNYVKNILSFFVIYAFYRIIKEKRLRQNPLLSSFLITYLGILALSHFAQSERFHLPALPISIIFTSYGISIFLNKHKKYYSVWLVFIFFVIVGWSWFKLAGRGLV